MASGRQMRRYQRYKYRCRKKNKVPMSREAWDATQAEQQAEQARVSVNVSAIAVGDDSETDAIDAIDELAEAVIEISGARCIRRRIADTRTQYLTLDTPNRSITVRVSDHPDSYCRADCSVVTGPSFGGRDMDLDGFRRWFVARLRSNWVKVELAK